MANTYIQIGSTVTVGSGGAASIDFTSIPSTYTDLLLKVSAKSTFTPVSEDDLLLRFNSSSSGYTLRNIQGNGSSASSTNFSYSGAYSWLGTVPDANAVFANVFGNGEIYIPNYAGSTNKSFSADVVSERNATFATATLTAGLWSNIAAITSISLTSAIGNMAEFSTATLYGISKST